MKKLSAIIVDDEQHCTDRLLLLLEEHSETIEVAATCSDIEEAKAHIENEKPDIVFLDVQLHEQTGFDLLAQIEAVDFEVIFTTAFDSYAIKAFKFSALDYLLKPLDREDLNAAIDRLKTQKGLKNASRKIETLLYNFNKNIHQEKHLAVPTLEGLDMIAVKNITHLQSDANYTHIHILPSKKITAPKNLKYFEDILDENLFFRIHKSHLVNLSFINSYLKGKGGYVVLTDGTKLEVAVRRKEELLKRLNTMN
ncbi:LytR/AlgR family response regulator transcription factor [Allomuricauda sp. SCSIO 65647]|uniref:LytR/AlgR family response regulator transcription factor n=1 Tax=Allomuricauda sp. SCSIO 65647 TaxID=2908843 RepID=UPI001F283ACE|nr:LytTR family DNA-binding domain-containing protein [Muricauda sp. SCSIO 65647]UJH68559.1 LytTR family DNA-binding domain-containing protein [Muricauda sp. SCSIO 65647]